MNKDLQNMTSKEKRFKKGFRSIFFGPDFKLKEGVDPKKDTIFLYDDYKMLFKHKLVFMVGIVVAFALLVVAITAVDESYTIIQSDFWKRFGFIGSAVVLIVSVVTSIILSERDKDKEVAKLTPAQRKKYTQSAEDTLERLNQKQIDSYLPKKKGWAAALAVFSVIAIIIRIGLAIEDYRSEDGLGLVESLFGVLFILFFLAPIPWRYYEKYIKADYERHDEGS